MSRMWFMKRPPLRLVSSPSAWRVLMSPVRHEIVEAVRLLGPCSIADVAELIDRPADSLYKHVQQLQDGGFIAEAGFRKGDRNVEQLIDVVADDFAIDFQDNTGDAENDAVVATANSFLKAAARAVRDSAEARQLQFQSQERNISINYELSWLTPEAFQEVRELIRRLKQLMDDGKKRREGRLYLTLAIAAPVTRRRRASHRTRESKAESRKIRTNVATR